MVKTIQGHIPSGSKPELQNLVSKGPETLKLQLQVTTVRVWGSGFRVWGWGFKLSGLGGVRQTSC